MTTCISARILLTTSNHAYYPRLLFTVNVITLPDDSALFRETDPIASVYNGIALLRDPSIRYPSLLFPLVRFLGQGGAFASAPVSSETKRVRDFQSAGPLKKRNTLNVVPAPTVEDFRRNVLFLTFFDFPLARLLCLSQSPRRLIMSTERVEHTRDGQHTRAMRVFAERRRACWSGGMKWRRGNASVSRRKIPGIKWHRPAFSQQIRSRSRNFPYQVRATR